MARYAPWLLVLALAVGVGLALVGRPAEPPARPAEPVAAGPDQGDPSDLPDLPDPNDMGSGGAGAAPQAASGDEVTLTGVVREHMDVAQYTYLHLATDKGVDTWAAVYKGPIKDGSSVVVEHAVRLDGFHSKELNRDFPVIYFGMLPGVTSAPSSTAMAGTPNAPAGSVPPPAVRPRGSIKIADLATRASALKGQSVTIAGRVVKETDGVLDRNWIHVKDGSGDAKAGTDDVLVTTDGTSKVGEDVIVTGSVNTDQDFGSGYAYKFLLEHATVRPATSM